MRILFFFFTLFILLLAELMIGTQGLYLPLAWMGYFYFFEVNYNRKLLFISGFAGALFADIILYQRILLPDVLILCAVIFTAWRYKEFWRKSIRCGSIFGIYIIIISYMIQFAASLWTQGFSWHALSDKAALMTALIPFGCLLQMFIIFICDTMQKKMKFEGSFVAENKDNNTILYRRRRHHDD